MSLPKVSDLKSRRVGDRPGGTVEVSLIKVLGWLLNFFIIGLVLFYILFPIYWLFLSSLKSPAHPFTVEYWPQNATLLNYRVLASNAGLVYGLYNSIIVSIAVLILTLAFGSLAAYALGRFKFRGRNLVRYATLAMMAFPHIAIMGGLYLLIRNPCALFGGSCFDVQLYNTRTALIITYLMLTLPITVWFLADYYRRLPRALEEAAYVDGATPFQTFYLVFLPLSLPGLVTTAVLSFIISWNEFLFALTFTIDTTSQTAPVALARYGFGAVTFALAAAAFISVPVILLALTFQRQLISALVGLSGRELHPWEHLAGRATHWFAYLRLKPLWRRLGLNEQLIRWPVEMSPAEKILGGMLGLALFSFFFYSWNVISFPYPVDYGEGPMLEQSIRLAHFQNIYRADLSHPPYTIANYPPLYLLIQAPFAWLFGPAYWYGRLISWLGMMAAALFIGLILYELTGVRRAALIGGLTLLAIPYAAFWAPFTRIDSVALSLSLAALFVVVRRSGRPGDIFVAALLLTAAVYTRQSYGLAAPLAAFVWLFSRPPRRRAFILAAEMIAIGGSLFLLLNFLTGGGFFFHTVTANINEFSRELLYAFLESLWFLMAGLLSISLLFLLAGGWFQAKGWRLIGPYLVGAALSTLTIGKLGSNVNYFLELSAAASLAMGAFLAWQRSRPPIYTGLALVLAVQIFFFLPGLPNHWAIESKIQNRADLDLLTALVRRAGGPVLADEYMGLLPLAGQPIYIQPFEFSQLAKSGLWDQKPFLQAIARREFPAILLFRIGSYELYRDRWTPEMLAAIDQHYRKVQEFGEVFTVTLYRPR